MPHEIIKHALGKGLERDAPSSLVAEATTNAVRLLLLELKPLVGELATAALYKRGVHLAKSSLQRLPDHAKTSDDLLAPLQQDLASRSPEEAQQVGVAVLTCLVDLLISLIGDAITHRLLRKAWGVEALEAATPEEKPQ